MGRQWLQHRRKWAWRRARHRRRAGSPPPREGLPRPARRWVVERTFGWLTQHRRLVRDYEPLPQRTRAMIHWAMANTMSRYLTGESAPTWRNESP
ncbi:transposase [Micromonospora sp. CA-259024]|uniref:transposase n=1 Tax=Micromonospora sp. CA-259024 TaxID=3239965 RepID=UPI003D8CF7D8